MKASKTIYIISAEDATQHLGKLKEILEGFKKEDRIAGYVEWAGEEANEASFQSVKPHDMVVLLLTEGIKPQKAELEQQMLQLKNDQGQTKIAEIIIDNLTYDMEFLAFPTDLEPIRSRTDMDGIWSKIGENLRDMFPAPAPEGPPVDAKQPAAWKKWLPYLLGAALLVVLAIVFWPEGPPTPNEKGQPPVVNNDDPVDDSADSMVVTSLATSVSPSQFSGECPKQFNFMGKITVDKPGSVKYTWLRSDGATSPIETLNFTVAGSKTVTTTWRLGGSGQTYNGYWKQLKIIEPEEKLSNRATFSLNCKASSTANLNLNFKNRGSSRILNENAFANEGISRVRARPSGTYCSDARPAILARGTYSSPYSYLSTARPGGLNSCNGVVLEFWLATPVKNVTIEFYGAATDYALTAYSTNGTRLGVSTAQGRPYNYDSPFSVSYSSGRANISRITFGRQAALTQIVSIKGTR